VNAACKGGSVLAPSRHDILEDLVLALVLLLKEHTCVGRLTVDDLAAASSRADGGAP
jgi:hypothetical protein